MSRPTVFLIARPSLNLAGIRDWLASLDAESCLERVTGSAIERLTELAGRRCYKSFEPGLNPNVTRITEESAAYHANVIRQRHGSVYEHGMFTFAIEGVSRVFTHELVRHRVGTAFSQESLRYVRLTGSIPHWLPPVIRENEAATEVFVRMFESMGAAQDELAEIFGINEMTDFGKKKELTSAFRRIAPIGLATGIVFSANVRTLRHLIPLRTSPAAEYEMQLVFGSIAEMMLVEAPSLFADLERRDNGNGLTHYHLLNEKI